MRINWGMGIALATGAFMVMILGFVVNSFQHSSELVADDYYQQELDYQQRMQAQRRGEASGEGIGISYNQGCLVISYPEPGWKGTVAFFRPSDKGLDFLLPMEADAQAMQCVPHERLAPGLWRVQFSWEKGGEKYYVSKSTVVP